MQRYKEHLRRARTLAIFFTGVRFRRVRGLFQFGKLPSRARLMAREGPDTFSIVPVEKMPENVRGTIPETKWINFLGMVLNHQLPFNGLDRLYWGHLLARDDGQHRSTKQVILDVVNGGGNGMEVEEALTLASKVVRHCDPSLFEKLFTIVKGKVKREWKLVLQRRVVLRVPSYSDTIISRI